MKQGLFILLLGFGYLAPFACSESKDKKQSEQQKPASPSPSKATNMMALYGPIHSIKMGQMSKA